MSNLACAHHRGSTPKGVMTSVNRGRTGVEGGAIIIIKCGDVRHKIIMYILISLLSYYLYSILVLISYYKRQPEYPARN